MNAPKTPDASDARLAGGLVRAAGIAVLLVVIAHTSADPDLWGHVRFGQDIIAAGQLPTNDSYSFTSDRPWINHEWLAEVLMAAAYAAGGARGLVALKALLAIGAIVLVTVLLRQRVPEGWHRAVLVAFTLLVGVAPLTRTMRPQVFSLVLFAALLVVISTAERSPRRWWLPPMFLVWANLHGAWLVGAGILVVWTAIRFIDKQSRPWRWHLVFVGLLSAAATLVNPYGLELWRFMFSTVGLERGDIVEWHAITQLPILLLPWGLSRPCLRFGPCGGWNGPISDTLRCVGCSPSCRSRWHG